MIWAHFFVLKSRTFFSFIFQTHIVQFHKRPIEPKETDFHLLGTHTFVHPHEKKTPIWNECEKVHHHHYYAGKLSISIQIERSFRQSLFFRKGKLKCLQRFIAISSQHSSEDFQSIDACEYKSLLPPIENEPTLSFCVRFVYSIEPSEA